MDSKEYKKGYIAALKDVKTLLLDEAFDYMLEVDDGDLPLANMVRPVFDEIKEALKNYVGHEIILRERIYNGDTL